MHDRYASMNSNPRCAPRASQRKPAIEWSAKEPSGPTSSAKWTIDEATNRPVTIGGGSGTKQQSV